MAKTIQTKREREKAMVSDMIALYCRKQHGVRGGLCVDCSGNKKRKKKIGEL